MAYDLEYTILQSKYRKLNNDKANIFPKEWYYIKEYDLKKQILQECLENNVLIFQSRYYYQYKKLALK